jgi:hypothetical protein
MIRFDSDFISRRADGLHVWQNMDYPDRSFSADELLAYALQFPLTAEQETAIGRVVLTLRRLDAGTKSKS